MASWFNALTDSLDVHWKDNLQFAKLCDFITIIVIVIKGRDL